MNDKTKECIKDLYTATIYQSNCGIAIKIKLLPHEADALMSHP